MPWQDNSGSNGGPTKGPWGQPPNGGNNGQGGGRGGESPDLEELLQASRQRLKRAFPRSGGGGGRGGRKGPELNGRTLGLAGLAILGLWGVSGFYTVDAGELGVVTTFGEFDTVTPSGLNWHIPAPVQDAKVVNVGTIRRLNIPTAQRRGNQGEGLMLTGDKNIVDIAMVVQYKIKPELQTESGLPGVAQFLFNVDDPERVVRAVAEASIREVVGRNSLDFVQTSGRTTVQSETRNLIQASLDQYEAGIEVTEVNLTKTDPPTQEVNDAFLDVEAADQDKQRAIDSARAYANKIVPEARGEAQRILENARGYSARVTAESRGQAERFTAILTEYQKAPEVTRQRMYLETVEEVLGDMNKIIVEDDAGSGVVPYLPLNELGRNSNQGGQ